MRRGRQVSCIDRVAKAPTIKAYEQGTSWMPVLNRKSVARQHGHNHRCGTSLHSSWAGGLRVLLANHDRVRSSHAFTNAVRKFALVVVLVLSGLSAAEDIEPRRWTPLPVGTTVVGAGVVRTAGNIAFDPVLKIEDATVEVDTTLVSVVHAFDLLGKTARFDVHLPQQHARWEGLLDGEPRTVERRGLADPRLRLSINLLGSPALRGQEFASYRSTHRINTVIGAALAVTLPLGEYQKDKLLNLGQNRFAVQPQLGVVHNHGPWSYELTGSASFFTKNGHFLVNHTREQDPILLMQTHAVYSDPRGWWASISAAYDWSGKSRVDGVTKDDYREDLLYGISMGLAVSRQVSAQIAYVANRVQTKVGSDLDNLAMGLAIKF